MTRRTGLLFALALALAVFVVDQGIKSIVEGSMRVGESIIIMPGFLSLTYIRNDGGAFGMFGGSQMVLLLGSTVAVVETIDAHNARVRFDPGRRRRQPPRPSEQRRGHGLHPLQLLVHLQRRRRRDSRRRRATASLRSPPRKDRPATICG